MFVSIKGDSVLKQQWPQLHIVCLQKTMVERMWFITNNFICISHKLLSSFFSMSKYLYAKMLWDDLFSWWCPFWLFLNSLTYLKNWARTAENVIMNQTLHHGYCSSSGMLKNKNQVSWIDQQELRFTTFVKIFMDLLSWVKSNAWKYSGCTTLLYERKREPFFLGIVILKFVNEEQL